jgi:hypothetical protein
MDGWPKRKKQRMANNFGEIQKLFDKPFEKFNYPLSGSL